MTTDRRRTTGDSRTCLTRATAWTTGRSTVRTTTTAKTPLTTTSATRARDYVVMDDAELSHYKQPNYQTLKLAPWKQGL